MRYPLALLAISMFPSIALAQPMPPMPTSFDGAERLVLPKASRMDDATSLRGFAAINRGKCKTPVSVDRGINTISVPIFVLVSGLGQIARVVPLNTECPGLDLVAAKEQLRVMRGNTPVPADGQPHWYLATVDFSVKFEG